MYNFQKISGGACPPIPFELFLFLIQVQTNSAEKKKNTLEKNVEITAPLL